jgi:hypothetical protein
MGHSQRPIHRMRDPSARCIRTGRDLPLNDLLPVAVLRPALAERLRAEIGDLPPDAMVAREEVDRLRLESLADLHTMGRRRAA